MAFWDMVSIRKYLRTLPRTPLIVPHFVSHKIFDLIPRRIYSGVGEEPPEEVIFEDNFTGGIKPEWVNIVGDWEHNSEFDALQIICEVKGKTKVNITIPNDVLVESKIIELNTLENTYFDLLSRYSFDTDSGYAIAYVEVYSRLYDLALTIFKWTDNSRSPGLVYKTWAELGLTGVADLAGKIIGIKCEGNVIKGYLDEVEIMSVIDDTYSSGQAGIIAHTGVEAFIFDDFKIKG